ncbi:DEAD/DEAH box helicase [Acinetobacter sp. Root1280]|uniref:SNF2-related protein n=1 Tax=Acinetobacter sp. Root1280 TaxID=1736444 RepID=UPI0006FBA25F|nr:SNF2-related protein [Acinetobacter sp. Root1280]KQW98370.1 DEAD/DEAH box helicase [Acinetobacter sp. Root1280]
MSAILSNQQKQYLSWLLTKKSADNSIDSLASTLIDSQVDLNPHQVDAALFAFKNPLSQGVLLADEVGLGKTIEAGLVIAQTWAERKKRILIITPANLRKQWYQELYDKFGLKAVIFEAKIYNQLKKEGNTKPFIQDEIIICSYQFAKSKANDLKNIAWDLVVIDEAHRLRNVYKKQNVTANLIKQSLAHVHNKVLLTATPLQNSLLELYGLVSILDERVFGDLESFKSQFITGDKEVTLPQLRARLATVCKRTLRQQVQPFVSYTARRAIVQDFTPSKDEQQLRELVADYLRRPNLQALPVGQRQLISLVLWKLLASSTQAIAGALATMTTRLEKKLLDQDSNILDELDDDYEALTESGDDYEELLEEDEILSAQEKQAIELEIAELKEFQSLAINIKQQSKGQALLTALETAFEALQELGAERKAIIFTESKRTQEYLTELLKGTSYFDGLVLFNGTNNDDKAKKIYKEWIERYKGTDRVTGAKSADTRAALVDYFKEQGSVMIATEAGAEGINLQFCSLIINYDLPWNPQRIEQRIGRCHRYGQKHDVVVVNFVDRSNEADSRVYDLLSEKFQLFDGVFGASDEILGTIGSGMDFEKRIAEIYQECRDPEEIAQSFESLQNELSAEINEAMLNTRNLLMNHFDENVLYRIKSDAVQIRQTYEQYLLALLNDEFSSHKANVVFDENGFQLNDAITIDGTSFNKGRYDLAKTNTHEHVIRLNHPFVQALLDRFKAQILKPAKLVFDYDAYGLQVSSLKPFIGNSGFLIAELLEVSSLGRLEQHLVLSAITNSGEFLADDDPEKLLKLPMKSQADITQIVLPEKICLEQENRKNRILEEVNVRNLGFFDQEIIKLDGWADDLKNGLEVEIKEIDKAIKEARKSATIAASLQDKLNWQKTQRELEMKRTKLRRELFDRQDEIDMQCNELIGQLEGQLEQKIAIKKLFMIEWQLK